MLSDLSEVIRNVSQPLTNSQIKSYMRMLLNGVSFCHENRIMHRVKSQEEENNSNSFSI
jgi:cell cycle related kinase